MSLMLYHSVYSQVISIEKTDLAQSTIKRHKHCYIMPIFMGQHSFLLSKKPFSESSIIY
jgi:hypothetical protein